MKNKGIIFFVILFHIVGLLGFRLGFTETFLKLVPFHLLLMAVLLWLAKEKVERNFSILSGIIIVLGIGIEIIGVARGDIFGIYHYGQVLGIKVLNAPVLIGLNWWLIAYSAGVISSNIGIDNYWTKCFAGAGLMVLQDLFIEPIAIKYQYWFWQNDVVPHQNYIAWYLFSFVLMLLFHRFSFDKTNRAAWSFYLSQLLFFVLLHI